MNENYNKMETWAREMQTWKGEEAAGYYRLIVPPGFMASPPGN